jgi:hypothetical protein
MRPCRSLASITLNGLLLFAVGCSRAATPAEPAVLATLKDQGVQVAGEFASPVGVRAFAGEAGDTPIAIYVLPDGSAVVGRRLDAKGKLLDQERLAALVAKPAADRVLAMLEKASWIYKNGLWVEFEDSVIPDAKRCNDHYVIVTGIFNAKDQGHMGLWSGSITNISRIYARPAC